MQLAMEAFECLGGNLCTDEEVLFVFSVMTAIAAWGLGNEEYWMQVGQDFRRRLNGAVPNPAQFANRSAYGEYFGHQASGR